MDMSLCHYLNQNNHMNIMFYKVVIMYGSMWKKVPYILKDPKGTMGWKLTNQYYHQHCQLIILCAILTISLFLLQLKGKNGVEFLVQYDTESIIHDWHKVLVDTIRQLVSASMKMIPFKLQINLQLIKSFLFYYCWCLVTALDWNHKKTKTDILIKTKERLIHCKMVDIF